MDGKAQSSTVDGSETTDNSPLPSPVQLKQVAQEAADYLLSLGLTVPYDNAFQRWMLEEPRKRASATEDPTGLTPWIGLPDCSIPSGVSAPEKWEVRGRSLALRRDVCKIQNEAEVEGYMRQIRMGAEAKSIREIKLELPVLRTDNETDLRRHTRRINAAREVHLSNHHLPLEPCDEDKDEGLRFPPEAYAADRKIVQSVESEKIEISRHSFEALVKYMNAEWTESDQDAMLRSQVEYKAVWSCLLPLKLLCNANLGQLIPREPVTPPLTPRLQAQEAFVPDKETSRVPDPSDPSTVLSDDLRTAEDRIFDEDSLDLADIDIEQLAGFDDACDVHLRLLPDAVQKPDDLKVEEPLLTAAVGDQTLLSPNFGELRNELSLDDTTVDALQCQPADEELAESLKEMAASVMMELEQEKLEPLDATIRVNVPVLDFSVAEPEWCKFRGDTSAMFKSIPREAGVLFDGAKWSRKLVEDSKLNWRPWTSQNPRPAVEEAVGDAKLLAPFLEPPEGEAVRTSSDFVRKRPGLAILDHVLNDDEEELQCSNPLPQTPQAEWMTLIRKRKLLLDGNDSRQNSHSKETRHRDKSRGSVRTHGAPGKLLVQEEEGAAATLLDNYLEMHAPKKMRIEHSPFFNKTDSTAAEGSKYPPKRRDSGSDQPDVSAAKATLLPDVGTAELGRHMVCPELPLSDKPVRMIVAVSIPRGMIRHLEQLIPGLHMLDRDYNAHNSSVWIPGSICRSEVASAIAYEADLIPSPSTGIILTTLIKLRQKPVPGAKRKTAHLASRVESVAARYERLVVLVSEDNKLDESMNDMSASDAASFAEFQASAATLSAETTVLYVGGGAETLARWAAAIAARHAAGIYALQDYLREEETHWELFLRRAGMNPYAAQVVLGMLRASEGEPSINHERAYGLPAFVKMPEEQRYDMFEGVLGGRQVLARVGRVVDASWEDGVGRPV